MEQAVMADGLPDGWVDVPQSDTSGLFGPAGILLRRGSAARRPVVKLDGTFSPETNSCWCGTLSECDLHAVWQCSPE